ncbi:MAG: ATP-binding cassette domain-containing protein [Eubacterium sp.]|nr:ATP-binding cassette domain-containing protein [Eubacterium sp.]
MKTKSILQMEATECGAACLTMILHYFGKELSLEEVREAVDVSRDGSKAGNIMRACPDYQLEVHGYRKELEALYKLEPPCIIHWNFNHFVVYEGRNEKYVFINDPAAGRRRITPEELDKSYTGVVMTFRPTPEFQKEKRPDAMWTMMKENINACRKEYAFLVLMGLMLTVPGIVLAACSQFFVERILGVSSGFSMIFGLVSVMAFCLAFQAVFSVLRYRVLDKLRNKILLLRDYRLLRHLFRLPMTFFDQRYAGDISTRLNSNLEASSFLSGEFTELIIDSIQSVFFLVVLLFYSRVLTIVVLAGAVLNLILVLAGSGKLKESAIRMNMEQGKITGSLMAGIGSIDSMKSSGSEEAYLSRLLGQYAKVISGGQRIARTQQYLQSSSQGILVILNSLILLIGSMLVVKGHMTVGGVVAFGSLFNMFIVPVTSVTNFFMRIQTIRSTLLRLQDIQHYKEEEKYSIPDSSPEDWRGSLKVRHLNYGYSRLSGAVIHDFNLEMEPGKMVALVGDSGCGKSTVAKVLGGLYRPWSGEVLIDEKDTSGLSGTALRGCVAAVAQNVAVFSGTVKDNITMWDDRIEGKDVISATKDACIHEYITTLNGGYGSCIEEGGRNFSVGQKQRLEIARALVLNPKILILDEATSALDPITEKDVLDNIRKRNCTCLIIAHRLSAVRDCDEILVMEKGVIVERGTHDELMRLGKHYAELVNLN